MGSGLEYATNRGKTMTPKNFTIDVKRAPKAMENHFNETLSLLEEAFASFDYTGVWELRVNRQVKQKSPKKLCAIRALGNIVLIRTKPKGNDSVWESSLTVPAHYEINKVFDDLSNWDSSMDDNEDVKDFPYTKDENFLLNALKVISDNTKEGYINRKVAIDVLVTDTNLKLDDLATKSENYKNAEQIAKSSIIILARKGFLTRDFAPMRKNSVRATTRGYFITPSGINLINSSKFQEPEVIESKSIDLTDIKVLLQIAENHIEAQKLVLAEREKAANLKEKIEEKKQILLKEIDQMEKEYQSLLDAVADIERESKADDSVQKAFSALAKVGLK